MRERFVDVTMQDSPPMDIFITHPEQDGPFPTVVIFMDIWGLREELFDIARRIATVGYYCVVPNFYHREGKIRFEYRDDKGKTISIDRLDDAAKKRVLAPLERLTNAMVVSDIGTLIDFVRAGEPGRTDAMGSVGFCMGGRHALCAAGHFPQNFVASASLHGTALIADQPDSPHLLAKQFRGEIYCGFGETDPFTPPPLVTQMQELLAPCVVEYNYLVHPGVTHGYALPDRDVFDKQATNRDWERIFAMFHRHIPAYSR